MDTIIQLVLMIVSAWLAYAITSALRRTRPWGGLASVGIFLALFGNAAFGLLAIWNWLSPKLTDSRPSENDLLFTGLIITAVIVVLSLDLWGRIDIMGKMRDTINKPGTSA